MICLGAHIVSDGAGEGLLVSGGGERHNSEQS
jgi:hypothetical protein